MNKWEYKELSDDDIEATCPNKHTFIFDDDNENMWFLDENPDNDTYLVDVV